MNNDKTSNISQSRLSRDITNGSKLSDPPNQSKDQASKLNKIYGKQFYETNIQTEHQHKCPPTQRIYNKQAAKKILIKYGLFLKDVEFFKLKKRILRKLGHINQKGEELSPDDI